MTTGFEPSTTAELRTLALKVKDGIIEMSNLSDEKLTWLGRRGCPAGESFWIRTYLLALIEETLIDRGIDPRHPAFGPDIMAVISEEMASAIADGERKL